MLTAWLICQVFVSKFLNTINESCTAWALFASLTYDNMHDKDNNSLRLPEAWLITAIAESKSKFTKMTGDFDT